ncbi:MAG: 2Fe-2S iron-sulfur cluster-binding protein, partial [Chloroflexi bacterium]|nr:2Fe-2S iron-sulfur cluster-binding protein [Chloroflexota bacterium]
MTTFTLNGKAVSVEAPGDTPLLWVIRDYLGLTGTKFGCGAGQCGACTVHVNGIAVRSCSRPLDSVEGAKIVTIEGLGGDREHPLQKYWVRAQVPQCGYCQSGSIMQAAALLMKNLDPTDDEIIKTMSPILCRCMTYVRVKSAIQAAAKEMREAAAIPGHSEIAEGKAASRRSSTARNLVTFGSIQSSDASLSTGNRLHTLWFDMDTAGVVTINITKAEIGQHVGTALAQALAEELEVRWEDVRIRHVDSDAKWGLMLTGGSWSVN